MTQENKVITTKNNDNTTDNMDQSAKQNNEDENEIKPIINRTDPKENIPLKINGITIENNTKMKTASKVIQNDVETMHSFVNDLKKQNEDKFKSGGDYPNQFQNIFTNNDFSHKFIGEENIKKSVMSISESFRSVLQESPRWMNINFK